MALHWSEPEQIVTALMAAYPETDRVTLSLPDLSQMVKGLADYGDDPDIVPTGPVLENILWIWMRRADQAAGGG